MLRLGFKTGWRTTVPRPSADRAPDEERETSHRLRDGEHRTASERTVHRARSPRGHRMRGVERTRWRKATSPLVHSVGRDAEARAGRPPPAVNTRTRVTLSISPTARVQPCEMEGVRGDSIPSARRSTVRPVLQSAPRAASGRHGQFEHETSTNSRSLFRERSSAVGRLRRPATSWRSKTASQDVGASRSVRAKTVQWRRKTA